MEKEHLSHTNFLIRLVPTSSFWRCLLKRSRRSQRNEMYISQVMNDDLIPWPLICKSLPGQLFFQTCNDDNSFIIGINMTIVFASIFLLQFISTFALLSGSLSALGSCSVVQNQRHGITPSIQSHQNELIQGNIQQIGICVLSEDAELYDTARSLAERLSIPFVSETTSDIFDHYNHALTIIRYPIGSTEGTALGIQSLRRDSHHNINRKGRQIPLPTPFFVDFCPQEGSTDRKSVV